jgi:hypothetical protein
MWLLLEIAVALLAAVVLLAVLVSAMAFVVSPGTFMGWRQRRPDRFSAGKKCVRS